jgi:hypothetical protein
MPVDGLSGFRRRWSCRRLVGPAFGLAGSILFLLACPLPAAAAVLALVNGDRISGDLAGFERGKLQWKSSFGGTVKVPLREVLHFRSDTYVDVEFTSGRTWRQCLAVREGREWQFECVNGNNVTLTADTIKVLSVTRRKAVLDRRGQVDFTLQDSRAETHDFTTRLTADTDWRRDVYKHNLHLDIKKEIEDDVVTERLLSGEYQLDYYFREQWYALGLAGIEREPTDDGRRLNVLGTGLGYEWIQRARLSVANEVAFGRIERHYDVAPDNRFNAIRIRTLVEYTPERIDVRFRHENTFLSDEDGGGFWQFRTENSASLPVNKRLELIVKYLTEHVRNAVGEFQDPETELTAGFSYRF